jgi:hypothetical protein
MLFADEMADRWPTLPHKDLGGQTPIDAMGHGGVNTMLEIQGRLDNLLDGTFA